MGDGRPAMLRGRVKPGQWLGPFYIVDAAGGQVEFIEQCLHWTREEIQQHGQEIRTKRANRTRRKPVDGEDGNPQ